MFRLLGGIEVKWQNEHGKWIEVGSLDEIGPIATDVQLVKLPRLPNRQVKLQLTMTQGLWRLHYLALAKLEEPIKPVRLQPYEVTGAGGEVDEEARLSLTDSTRTLVTLPGEAYTFRYRLPDPHQEYELFLESKGYYYEWMRNEWVAEQNPRLSLIMKVAPGLFMKKMAPGFKKLEAAMEETFWKSRYVKE
jgi:hypothetical protein